MRWLLEKRMVRKMRDRLRTPYVRRIRFAIPTIFAGSDLFSSDNELPHPPHHRGWRLDFQLYSAVFVLS